MADVQPYESEAERELWRRRLLQIVEWRGRQPDTSDDRCSILFRGAREAGASVAQIAETSGMTEADVERILAYRRPRRP